MDKQMDREQSVIYVCVHDEARCPYSTPRRPERRHTSGVQTRGRPSTLAPLPSPVQTLCSAGVAWSEQAERRATRRETTIEAVKLPGVVRMLHGDSPVSLTSGWKQSPVLNTGSPQPQQLLPEPESSIPSLSDAGLRWALTPPVISPETNHFPSLYTEEKELPALSRPTGGTLHQRHGLPVGNCSFSF
ncbi:hypothetical protein BFJ63_vAg18116 [Fusarium oxysporum f. sp. narcissi]|uniref:Uncharacterized protein n=1 Tax=Fusarium oxysporum f. sp. narcissi TaxID=451672 RepID=A0A4V1RXR3_FUSOX|nr:hypothetical protein BFJ63_vAg18116 [Fusarium oxysporum f. sp. narcissi]